jgi:hypothetical protein
MERMYSIVFSSTIKIDLNDKSKEELNNGKGSDEPKEVSK